MKTSVLQLPGEGMSLPRGARSVRRAEQAAAGGGQQLVRSCARQGCGRVKKSKPDLSHGFASGRSHVCYAWGKRDNTLARFEPPRMGEARTQAQGNNPDPLLHLHLPTFRGEREKHENHDYREERTLIAD